MNNNEQNSSLSLGCSIAGLVFFGLVLLILLIPAAALAIGAFAAYVKYYYTFLKMPKNDSDAGKVNEII